MNSDHGLDFSGLPGIPDLEALHGDFGGGVARRARGADALNSVAVAALATAAHDHLEQISSELQIAGLSALAGEPEPAVTTDKDDYAPGETATITATGFRPGATLTFEVDHVDGAGEDGIFGTADDSIAETGGEP